MPYTLAIRDESTLTRFQVTGDNSPETVAGYLAEIGDAIRGRDCSRILIEENLQGPSLDIVEIFRIMAGSKGTWNVRKIAFVDLNPEHDTARLQFAETAASGLGFPIRMFATVEEALQWLADSTSS